jgi:hypothetical protein
MPPDQLNKGSGPFQNPHPSLQQSLSSSTVVTELTRSSELGTGSSRKHDRHDDQSRGEDPSKPAKVAKISEQSTRKDVTTAPENK